MAELLSSVLCIRFGTDAGKIRSGSGSPRPIHSWAQPIIAKARIGEHHGIGALSRKLPSSKYKGVVPQPNVRWGAQIYEKHQRVWLGTFNEEDEAACAYDQRFRGHDTVTNFKRLSAADHDGGGEDNKNSNSPSSTPRL